MPLFRPTAETYSTCRRIFIKKSKNWIQTLKKSNQYFIFLLFHLLLCWRPDLKALDDSAESFVWHAWRTDDGLPHPSVTALAQSQDGYLWIGTPAGLARFDGSQFKIYSRAQTPDLHNDRITCLHQDRNQVLWIGTEGDGLYGYQDGIWQHYTRSDGLSHNQVRVIASNGPDELWVGTDYGLNRITKDGIQVFTTRNGLYDNIITALTFDLWGNLWIGTLQGGLACWRAGVFQCYDHDDGLGHLSVLSLAADQQGQVWIGTMEGLYCLNPDTKRIHYISGTAYTPISALLAQPNRPLWIGTMADGLKRLVAGMPGDLPETAPLPDDFVRVLLQDHQGNLWIGSDTGGLIRLKAARVRNLTRKNGLPENSLTALVPCRDGSLWVGTRSSGLCQIQGERVVRTVNQKSGLSSNRIRALLEDRAGSLWIGTEDGGINRLQDGRIERLGMRDGLASNRITTLLQDNAGTLWIGSDLGLSQVIAGRVLPISNPLRELAGIFVRVLLESRQGLLYIGTRNGLYSFDGISVVHLPPKNPEAEYEITALYEDPEGVLWLGTNGGGLKRFANGSFDSYTTESGLPNNHIFSIMADSAGLMWFSSSHGVFRIPRSALNHYARNKNTRLIPTCFDEEDGMASPHCSSLGQPNGIRTRTGTFYFATAAGIAIFTPQRLKSTAEAPNIRIEEVVVGKRSIAAAKRIRLPHRSSIDIHLTAFDFCAPEKLRFQYRLDPLQPGFIPLAGSSPRSVRYENLHSGTFHFIVQAANNDGVWAVPGAQLDLEVRASVFASWLFWTLALLVLAGLAVILKFRAKKPEPPPLKYKTSALAPQQIDEIVPRLLKLMEQEQIYLNPDLTLQDLAHRLKIHYNYLSQIIHERFGRGYNDFINQYRIGAAQRLLADPTTEKKNISEIMYQVGFYSKSVFNTVFKKFTGLTPSEYKAKKEK